MATIIQPYVSRVAPVQPSAPDIQLDKSVPRGLQQIGAAITDVGERAIARKNQQDEQYAQLGLMSLGEDAQQKLVEMDRDGPANGADLAKNYVEQWLAPETEKYLAGLPPRLREEYGKKVAIFRKQHTNNASNAEYKKSNDFSVSVIEHTAVTSGNGIVENPTRLQAFIEDFNSVVDTQPNLTSVQREKMKADFAQKAPALMAAELRRSDPDTLMAISGLMTLDERVDYIMPHLTDGVYFAETTSGANVQVSKAGARGAMQVMPATAREVAAKLNQPMDRDFLAAPPSEQNRLLDRDDYSFRYGKAYLREQLAKYNGDIELALIAYNAGGKRVEEFLKNDRRWNENLGAWARETGPYVATVTEHMGVKALAGRPMTEKTTGTTITGVRLPALFRDEQGRQPVNPEGLDADVTDKWELVQGTFGRQLPVVSAYRSPEVNAAAGGAKGSQHLSGSAIDVNVSSLGKDERRRLIKTASAAGFTGIGVYADHLHLDTGPARYWGPTGSHKSLPEWARGVVADHMASHGLSLSSPAPATSTGTAGSGAEGALRGAALPPTPKPPQFTGPVSVDLVGLPAATLLEIRSQAAIASKSKTEEEKKAEEDNKDMLIGKADEDAKSYLVSGQPMIPAEDTLAFQTALFRAGGYAEVDKWQSARYVNASIYEATKNLAKFDVPQINDLIKAVKPTGGENADLQIRIEEGVLAKVAAELEKRKDPATYVQSDPEVKAAEAKINPANQMSVENYYDAIAAAQARIGLPFTPLTEEQAKITADHISKSFIEGELAGYSSEEVAKSILSQLETQYGGYADDVYVQALSKGMDERVSKDTKQALSDNFVAWVRAKPTVRNPYNTLNNRLNYFQEIGDIEKATSPISDEAPPVSWMEYLGGVPQKITPTGLTKQVGGLWDVVGKPAFDAAGRSISGAFNDALERASADPPVGTPRREPLDTGPEPVTPVPFYDETPEAPAPGQQRRAPFLMPGVKDDDLDMLGTNAQDPAVQDRFRADYGDENLKQALKLLKERRGR